MRPNLIPHPHNSVRALDAMVVDTGMCMNMIHNSLEINH